MTSSLSEGVVVETGWVGEGASRKAKSTFRPVLSGPQTFHDLVCTISYRNLALIRLNFVLINFRVPFKGAVAHYFRVGGGGGGVCVRHSREISPGKLEKDKWRRLYVGSLRPPTAKYFH